MITWTIHHYVTGEGDSTTVNGDGDLCVWFFDSDHTTDTPDQRISADAHEFRYHSTGDEIEPPAEVKSEAAFAEVAAVYPNLGQREIRILGEAALEKIEHADVENTSLV